jgi:hypothetical protein
MGKMSKHYLPNGKEYKGAIHKMGGKPHTGAKHSASSKVLKHTKPKAKTA